jgi:hypothetical protein
MEGYLFLKKSQNKGTYGDSLVPKWSRRHCSIVCDPLRGSYLVARKRVEEGYLDHNKCISNAISFASSVVNLSNYSISVQDCFGPDGEVSGGVIRLRDASETKEAERKETIELRDKSQETAKKWKTALTEAQNAPKGSGVPSVGTPAQAPAPAEAQAQAQAQVTPFLNDLDQHQKDSVEDKENLSKSNIIPSPGQAKAKRTVGFLQPTCSDSQPASLAPSNTAPISIHLSAPITRLSLVPERVTPLLAQQRVRDAPRTAADDSQHGRAPAPAPNKEPVSEADVDEVELIWVAKVVERKDWLVVRLVCLVFSLLVATTTFLPNSFVQPSRFATSTLLLRAPEPLLLLNAPVSPLFVALWTPKSASTGPGHILTCANPNFVPEHMQTFEPYELRRETRLQPNGAHLAVTEWVDFSDYVPSAAQNAKFSAPVLLDVTVCAAGDELQVQELRKSAEAKLLAAANMHKLREEQERGAKLQRAERETLEQQVEPAQLDVQQYVVAEPAPQTSSELMTFSIPADVTQADSVAEDGEEADYLANDVEDFKAVAEIQSDELKAAPISLAARTGGGVLKVVTSPFRAVGWLVGKVVK